MKINYAVIAAAGYGSRLGKKMPKCMVEVNGKKIIEYQLEMLKDIPVIRMVVGYKANEVIEFVKSIREDVQFVINDKFDSTNTLQSYWLGAHDINDYFLLLDGDIIPNEQSLHSFIENNEYEDVVGVAKVTTEDAVFVHMDDKGYIYKFDRKEKNDYEWSNIAILHSSKLVYKNIYVYQRIEHYLPVKAGIVERIEIDTPEDMKIAIDILEREKSVV